MSGRIREEEIIEDMCEAASRVDGPLTVEAHREHGDISPSTAQSRFGSWNAAKKAAGLEVTRQSSGGPRIKCVGCGSLFQWKRLSENRGECPGCSTLTPLADGRLGALGNLESVRRLAEGPVQASVVARSELPLDVRESARTIRVTSSGTASARTKGVNDITYLAGDLRRAVDLFIEENHSFVEKQMGEGSGSLKQIMDDDAYAILLEQWYWHYEGE